MRLREARPVGARVIGRASTTGGMPRGGNTPRALENGVLIASGPQALAGISAVRGRVSPGAKDIGTERAARQRWHAGQK